MRTYIIGEAGVNHNGSMEFAKKLVDAAVDVGVDAVKFQAFKAEKFVTRIARKANYQVENTSSDESQYEMLKKLELSDDDHAELFKYCRERGLTFLSSPFDEESADMLDDLGMERFKIASSEITNKPLLQHIARKGKPIILSTGMADLSEVEKAVGWIKEIREGQDAKPNLTLLHCVSNYPAAVADVNLRAMKTMRVAFGLPVGYSDHTLGIEISIAAVALGAKVIEKHFTLDKGMQGPDHRASIDPDELKALVTGIKNVEKALGDGIKRISANEENTREIARRSLVAARDIKKGETLNEELVAVKRPGTGLAPEYEDIFIGRIARRDISKDSLFEWSDI